MCVVLLWPVVDIGACGEFSTIYLSLLLLYAGQIHALWTEM